MILGIRPQRPPLAAFFPVAGYRARFTGLITFHDSAKFGINQLFATGIGIPGGNRVNEITAA